MAETKTITTSHGLKRMSRAINETSVMTCWSICSVALTIASALVSACRRAFCSMS